MGTAIRILLVEDFEPFRSFTKSLLQEKPDFQIVCEVSDGLQAVLRAKELDPDLILMDIGLPGLNGIEAARQIRTFVPKARIVFLTQENSTDIVQEALSLGALGYVHKPYAGNDLLQAIEAALQGRQFVSNHPNGFPLAEGSARPATE
jgi:DNA-binding NarL/FixJ family response regulator